MRITNYDFVTENITCQNHLQHRHTTDKPHIYLEGVVWHKTLNCWLASIRVSGKLKHLGYYSNDDVAFLAWSLYKAGNIEAYELVRQHGRHVKDAGLLFISLFQKTA